MKYYKIPAKQVKKPYLAIIPAALIVVLVIFIAQTKDENSDYPIRKAAKTSQYIYSGKAHDLEINFVKKSEPDKLFVEITDNKNSIAVELKGDTEYSSSKTKDGKLNFENVFPNTDFSYKLIRNGLKEEIIVHEAESAKSSYVYEIKLSGLYPRLDENGQLLAKFTDGVSPAHEDFYLMPMYMEDGNGDISYDISYTIEEQSQETFILTVLPSMDWITSEERAWPVIIDPSIAKGESPALSLSMNEGHGNTAHDSSQNANHASLANTQWRSEENCISGNCLFFNGVDARATIANSSSIDFDEGLNGGFNAQAWIRVNSVDEEGDGYEAIEINSTVDTSTSPNATQASPQRKTFYDTVNSRYWALYYNGSAIEYAYSSDGEQWASPDTLAYNTNDFSIFYNNISDTAYIFLVTVCNNYDICLIRGTLATTSISWGSVVTVYDGTSTSDYYEKPTVAVSGDSHVFVAARKKVVNLTGNSFNNAVVTRSVNTATSDLSSWNSASVFEISSGNSGDLALIAQTSSNMLLVSGNNSYNISAWKYNGSMWTDTGNEYDFFGFEETPFNGNVNTFAVDGGYIYIGGEFTVITKGQETAPLIANYVARYHIATTTFEALGNSSTKGVNGAVNALSVDTVNNYLYVGGSFTTAYASPSDITVNNVVRVSTTSIGNSFETLGNSSTKGVSGTVNALSVDTVNNYLYVGGSFTTAYASPSNLTVNRITRISTTSAGNSFEALGNSSTKGFSGAVYALALDTTNNYLYVGGFFTTAYASPSNLTANNIARISTTSAGNSFEALGNGGTKGLNNRINALELDTANNYLYVGGSFTTAYASPSNLTANNIARISTTSAGNSFEALGNSSTKGVNSTVNALSLDTANNYLYVGGVFTTAHASPSNLTANYTTRISTTSAGNSFETLGSGNTKGVSGTINALALDTVNNYLYVGGSFTTAYASPSDITVNNVVRVSTTSIGNSFEALGNGGTKGFNNRVNALALDTTNNYLYIGGNFNTAYASPSNFSANSIARISTTSAGNSFEALGNGSNKGVVGTINALSVDTINNYLYVGGSLTTAYASPSNLTVNRITRISTTSAGNSFETMGDSSNKGVDNTVNTLLTGDTNKLLYLGGAFSSAGDRSAARLATYGRTVVTNVGSNSKISAISDSSGNVYLTYTKSVDGLFFKKYSDSTNSWGAETALTNSNVASSSISVNPYDNSLFVTWQQGQQLHYKKAINPHTSSDWDSASTNITTTGSNANPVTGTTSESGSHYMIYTQEDESVYSVKFYLLSEGEFSGLIFKKGNSTYLRAVAGSTPGVASLTGSFALNSSNATLTLADAISLNRWHHVAVGYTNNSNDEISVYIDGRVAGASTNGAGSPSENGENFVVGGGIFRGTFHGFIDEFKIYPYERTADQIKMDFNARGSSEGTAARFGENKEFLSDGLAGYWKMDDSSTPTVDFSGNGYNGTWVSGVSAGTGKFGGGTQHAGATGEINVGNISQLNTESFTFAGWVKRNSDSDRYIISKRDTSTGAPGYELRTSGTGEVFFGVSDDTSAFPKDGITTSGASINNGQWHHIVAIKDGTQRIQLYVNGLLAEEKNNLEITGSLSNSEDVRIGCGKFTGGCWNGSFDEFRFYNRTLSPTEINKLYNWAPGPVGHWKFNEGGGTDAIDSSGNNNTGTLTNGPIRVPGKFGKAVLLDGSNDYITVTNPTIDDFKTGSMTVSAWIKTSYVGTQSIVDNKTAGTNNPGFSLQINSSSGPQFRVANGSTQVSASSNTPINDGTWKHVVGIRDAQADRVRVYVNGTLVNESATSTTGWDISSSQNLLIGAYGTSAGNMNFLGLIDDVRIYNYARTPAQIIEDMNAGHPLGGSPVGSASIHYAFDEMRGTTANNSGALGSGSNGTISSGTWTPSGRINSALTFTASTSVSRTITDPGNVNTISLWLYPTTSTESKTLVTAPRLTTDSSSRPVYGGCTGTALPLDTWTHLLVTSNGSGSCAIYQNGVQTATGTTGVTFGTSLNIGGSSFTGRIDEFKMYYASFNAEQALIDYNAGSATSMGGVLGDSESDQFIDGAGAPPIGYWKFDEGSGGTLIDYSGNGVNGTWNGTGTPRYTTGKVGKAGDFNGSDDYVDLGNTYGTTSSFSVSFWLYYRANTDDYADIISRYNVSDSRDWAIFNDYGSLAFYLATSNSAGSAIYQSGNLVQNKWLHVTVVYDQINLMRYFYIDGKLDNSSSAPASIYQSGNNLNIGRRQTGARYANMLLDEVKIYNYARTPAQIAYDYNRGAPIGHWQMDECSGTTLHDISGNGNHGTLNLGASGQTSAGDCSTNANTARYNGREGKFNGSLNFDGVSDYVAIPDPGTNSIFDFGVGRQITLSAWIRPSSLPSEEEYRTIMVKGWTAGNNNGNYWLAHGRKSGNNVIGFCFTRNTYSDIGCYYTNKNIVNTDSWQHIVATFTYGTGSSMKVFHNGVLQTGAWEGWENEAPTQSNDPLWIGANGDPSDLYELFHGQIDDVRIYNYVLSPAQIKIVMNEDASVRFGE